MLLNENAEAVISLGSCAHRLAALRGQPAAQRRGGGVLKMSSTAPVAVTRSATHSVHVRVLGETVAFVVERGSGMKN